MQTQQHKELFSKIRKLPPEKVAVVDDFVEFLSHCDEVDRPVRAAGKLSEKPQQLIKPIHSISHGA